MEIPDEEYNSIDFKSEKDFTSEIDNINNLIKDNQGDWKKREAALKKLGGIILGNYCNNPEFLKIMNSKLHLNIFTQMADLRSSLMKEACKLLVHFSKVYGNSFENIVEKLFKADYLYKLLANQNKVIADNINNAILGVLDNCRQGKLIPKIAEQYKSKSNFVRGKLIQHLQFCLENFDEKVLVKYLDSLSMVTIKLTPDASSEVRSSTRKLYFHLVEIFPELEESLLASFETSVVKQLKEDKRSLDVSSFSKSIKSTFNSSSVSHKLDNLDINKENLSGSIPKMNNNRLVNEILNNEYNTSNTIKPSKNEEIKIKPSSNTATKPNKSLNINNSQGTMLFKENEVKTLIKPTKLFEKSAIVKPQQIKQTINKSTNQTNSISRKKSSQDYQAHSTENYLLELIEQTLSKDMQTKIEAFDNICSNFNDILNNKSFIHSTVFESLINTHFFNLKISFNKLSVTVMKSLIKFVFYLNDLFSEDEIRTLISLLMFNMTVKDEIIVQTSQSVMDILFQKVESNVICDSLLLNLRPDFSTSLQLIAIDLLHSMLDNIEDSLKKKEFASELINKLSFMTKFNNDIRNKVFEILEKVILIHKENFPILFTFNDQQWNCLVEFILNYKIEYKNYLSKKSTIKQQKPISVIIPKTQKDVQEQALTLASELNYDSFLNFLYGDKQNLENFLFAITKVKQNQVEGVLYIFKNLLIFNFVIIKEHIPLFFNRCLYLAERFQIYELEVIELLNTLFKNCNSELYLQIATKYLNDRNSFQVMKTILSHISICLTRIENDNLILLLPSFFENITSCLNHTISEIRKSAVMIIVDINNIIGDEFSIYLNTLSQNHRNLINIYINNKLIK